MPGRSSLHSFFDDCSHFQKKKEHTHTGFTNDNKTITKTITFGIKNGPCETLPFFFLFLSLSFPFPVSSFTFPFPSSFLFPVLFPFLFPFLFLFLSFSFPFLFPFPSYTIPFPFPFPRSCELFDQGVKPALGKTIRGKKR